MRFFAVRDRVRPVSFALRVWCAHTQALLLGDALQAFTCFSLYRSTQRWSAANVTALALTALFLAARVAWLRLRQTTKAERKRQRDSLRTALDRLSRDVILASRDVDQLASGGDWSMLGTQDVDDLLEAVRDAKGASPAPRVASSGLSSHSPSTGGHHRKSS